MLSRELANKELTSRDFFNFYTIIWWMFSVSATLLLLFDSLNQLILKYFIPVVFVGIIMKEGGFNLKNRGLRFYSLLTLWACLSLVYTVNMPMTQDYLQVMVGNIIIWYISVTCIQQIKDIRIAAFPLFVAFLCHVYFEFNTSVESYMLEDTEVSQLIGLSGNPNGLAFLLWYGAIMSVILLIYTKSKFLKSIFVLAILIFLYGIINTGSRKTLFASLAFGGTFIFLLGKSRNYGLFLVLLVVAFLSYEYLFSYIMENSALGARLSGEYLQRGVDRREELIGEGWTFFLSNPIMGIGLGSFTTFSKTHAMAHNDYIEILASMGIPALFIYLLIYVDYFKRVIRIVDKDVMGAIALSFFIGHLFLGMGRPTFLDPDAILIFAFFQGLVLKYYDAYIVKNNYENLPRHQHARLER